MKIAAKITTAKTKFAIGPATTMAARLATGWKKKLCARSAAFMVSSRAAVRCAGGVLIAEEFYVAAQRNGGNFPAGAVAIIEADDFRAESDGKHQDPHAAPAGDQEMAEFVEKHDQAEDE